MTRFLTTLSFHYRPQRLVFMDPEAKALSRYLLNGGFLMVDDFWGESMKTHFLSEMEKFS